MCPRNGSSSKYMSKCINIHSQWSTGGIFLLITISHKHCTPAIGSMRPFHGLGMDLTSSARASTPQVFCFGEPKSTPEEKLGNTRQSCGWNVWHAGKGSMYYIIHLCGLFGTPSITSSSFIDVYHLEGELSNRNPALDTTIPGNLEIHGSPGSDTEVM